MCNTSITGVLIGYDPGGNGAHGVATLRLHDGIPTEASYETVDSAEEAISWLGSSGAPLAMGVDTLTVLSTGPSGWRPADRWLRNNYVAVQKSVAAPNSLYGSMGLNGVAVIATVRQAHPDLVVSETHPKVLHHHLFSSAYGNLKDMNEKLARRLDLPVETRTDHEGDALISCYAAMEGLSARWKLDLHSLPTEPSERLVFPCGPSAYFWPGEEAAASDAT